MSSFGADVRETPTGTARAAACALAAAAASAASETPTSVITDMSPCQPSSPVSAVDAMLAAAPGVFFLASLPPSPSDSLGSFLGTFTVGRGLAERRERALALACRCFLRLSSPSSFLARFMRIGSSAGKVLVGSARQSPSWGHHLQNLPLIGSILTPKAPPPRVSSMSSLPPIVLMTSSKVSSESSRE